MHVSHTRNPFERVALTDEARKRLRERQEVEERRQLAKQQALLIREHGWEKVDATLADLRRRSEGAE